MGGAGSRGARRGRRGARRVIMPGPALVAVRPRPTTVGAPAGEAPETPGGLQGSEDGARMDNRERDLFEACLQLTTPAARQAFLRDAVGDDLDLAGRVERLLAAHESTQGLRESPARGLAGALPLPERIGPYRVLDQIGEGGMGVVYLGEQAQPVRRRVAIKVLKAGVGSADVLARFEAERQALALMSHPNVARIIYADVTEAGQPYFVMDYVRGLPITRYAGERRLDLDQRIRLFLQVCAATRHAHQKGIIHRDLKPSNILVSDEGGEPLARIIDFGIAKATHQPLTDRTLYTRVGQALGTPEYMSPEQADDSSPDVDTRTDVYSLGVVLYELLTGTRPFDFRDRSLAAVRRELNDKKPLAPSEAVVTRSDSDEHAARRGTRLDLSARLRGDLDAIVLKAMAREPERRYSSIDRFAEDIQNFLDDRPVTARPDSLAYRGSRFVRRHRPMVVASALVAASLVVGFVTAMWQAREARRQATLAAAARDQARSALATSREISEFMISLVGPDEGPQGWETRRAMLAAGVDRVDEYDGRPGLQAVVLAALARAYAQVTELDQAERLAERAIDVIRSEQPGGSALEAQALFSLAGVLTERAEHDSASVVLELARELVDRHVDPWDPMYAQVRDAEARSALAAGRHQEAADHYLATIEALSDADPDHPQIPEQLIRLGSAQRRAGQLDDAEQTFRDALDVAGRVPTVDPLTEPRARLQLGDLLFEERGDLARAEVLYRDALAEVERVSGPMSTHLAYPLNSLGALLAARGEFDEAFDLMSRTVRIFETTRGVVNLSTARQREGLAWIHFDTGRNEEGYRIIDEVVRVKLDLGATLPAVATLIDSGRRAIELGHFERARSYAERLEALVEPLSDDSRVASGPPALWGELYTALGRYETAEAQLLRALELAGRRPDVPGLLRDRLEELNRLYEAWGRPREAAAVRTRLEAMQPVLDSVRVPG